MTIDVEGMETIVLETIDWNNFACAVIIIETTKKDHTDHENILNPIGYLGPLYINEEHHDQLFWRPDLLAKIYTRHGNGIFSAIPEILSNLS